MVGTYIWQPNIEDTDLWPEYIVMVGKGSRCHTKVFSFFFGLHWTICHYVHGLCAADILYISYTQPIKSTLKYSKREIFTLLLI